MIEDMLGLKTIIDNLDITVLNIELYRVGTEWNYQNVNNPYSRIYYITEGYGRIRHHHRDYDLLADHLYLIPCYSTVTMFCPDHFTHFYVHFTARLQTGLDILSIFKCNHQAAAADCGIGRPLFERLRALNPDKELIEYDANKPIYKQVLDRAVHLDQDKSPGSIFETNAIIRLLLAVFFRDHDQPQLSNTLHGLKRFDGVLDYIHENLDAPLTIRQLAEIADLNPTYFSNLFSRLIGLSPIQYINKRRVEEAQKLLLSTDETLYQIGQQVGFADEYYFSRLFKKTVGISPDHYRKQNVLLHQR
jgi:AraC-like DNA-binding protein